MLELYTVKYGAKTLAGFGQGYEHLLGPQRIIPHTIIYGPEGSGKFSLMQAWLRERFGGEATKLRRKTWECVLPSKTIEVAMLFSSVHFVLDPTGWGQQDRNVLNKFIKDTCMVGNVGHFLQNRQQKIVVIRNTEILTENAQRNLRYLLDELQTPQCSIVFLTRELFKMQPAIVSRCQIIKRGSDSVEKIERTLTNICEKEDIDLQECHTIAAKSHGNWRYALSALQMMGTVRDGSSIIQKATRRLLCNLDPKKEVREEIVTGIRKDAYLCLTVVGINRPGLVLRNCIKELTAGGAVETEQNRMLKMAWEVDTLMCRGTRPVMHIERFLMRLWESGIADKYVERHGFSTC